MLQKWKTNFIQLVILLRWGAQSCRCVCSDYIRGKEFQKKELDICLKNTVYSVYILAVKIAIFKFLFTVLEVRRILLYTDFP